MITTNSRIGGKKPSGLMLPPMGILEIIPCVKGTAETKNQPLETTYNQYPISTLETTLEDIQVRHQLYMKDLLKPTS
ncbi:hypothetical protein Tco_1033089 [Tanacetum coccineum]|uniref:Uncharacterized protein n=1 Tax=Tanacetum coccineum TaxID=301880 RepID=A0ABQ5GEN0_9ASTR